MEKGKIVTVEPHVGLTDVESSHDSNEQVFEVLARVGSVTLIKNQGITLCILIRCNYGN
jgi:hypothetical protein